MASENTYSTTTLDQKFPAITPSSISAVPDTTAGRYPLGHANNPQTNPAAARNATIPVNWWATSTTPTNWAPGDFQIDLS